MREIVFLHVLDCVLYCHVLLSSSRTVHGQKEEIFQRFVVDTDEETHYDAQSREAV